MPRRPPRLSRLFLPLRKSTTLHVVYVTNASHKAPGKFAQCINAPQGISWDRLEVSVNATCRREPNAGTELSPTSDYRWVMTPARDALLNLLGRIRHRYYFEVRAEAQRAKHALAFFFRIEYLGLWGRNSVITKCHSHIALFKAFLYAIVADQPIEIKIVYQKVSRRGHPVFERLQCWVFLDRCQTLGDRTDLEAGLRANQQAGCASRSP
ncbi:hypothetical protein FB451DRAFT_1178076 [Mycena latifolia]|nr:hypothetical protein FB451DRAFT_1178076 [Mycena latifolia]